jgi:hypothetical protein
MVSGGISCNQDPRAAQQRSIINQRVNPLYQQKVFEITMYTRKSIEKTRHRSTQIVLA